MKGLTGFITGVILLVSFSSCQKQTGQSSNITTQSDSIYIKSFIILDSLRPPTQDTLRKFFFDYDNQKRVSRLREYNYYNSNSISFTSDVRFSYSGNDTLPSILYSFSQAALQEYDTLYLSYINGKVIRDSCAYAIPGAGVYGSFIKYDLQQLSNNYDTGSAIDSTFGLASSKTTVNSYVNWQNGNLIAEKDTFYLSPTLIQYQYKDYTYDQRLNPMRRAMLNFPTTAFYFLRPTMAKGNWYLNISVNNSVNNILTELDNPSYNLITWSYSYNSNGLPEKAIRKVATSIQKIYYYYTSM